MNSILSRLLTVMLSLTISAPALADVGSSAGIHGLLYSPLNVAGGTIPTKEWENLWRVFPRELQNEIVAHPEQRKAHSWHDARISRIRA